MEIPLVNSGEFDTKSKPFVDSIFQFAATVDAVNPVQTESAETYPNRCRVVIMDADTQKIVVIRRTRPGQEPYAVLPGGGLEPEDATPLDGIKREIDEELSIAEDALVIDDTRVLELPEDNQWVYFATAKPGELEKLSISGPEATRDPAVSGTYEPTWVSLEDLSRENVVPAPIRGVMELAYGRTSSTNQ